MSNRLIKTRWFWPWQDEKEEAWLEQMSASGWHLSAVGLMGRYTFDEGQPNQYTYRLDFMYSDKKKLPEYLQIFQDAGWEYIGEMANWRYWRKSSLPGETQEIFTDNESKIKKYQRLLLFMGFMLALLIFLGRSMLTGFLGFSEISSVIDAIYFCGGLLYAIIIPIYIVVCIKLMLRIRQLKHEAL
jgi:hypothetical protein